jgi:hypothetical protein
MADWWSRKIVDSGRGLFVFLLATWSAAQGNRLKLP